MPEKAAEISSRNGRYGFAYLSRSIISSCYLLPEICNPIPISSMEAGNTPFLENAEDNARISKNIGRIISFSGQPNRK